MPQTPPDTTDQDPTAAPDHVDDRVDGDVDRRWQLIRRLTLLATIVPIYVAAVRNGLSGWYPALDAATVVSRAHDVLGAHPPLVGMWASVSTDLGRATYFPGAIQLYLLAVPVRLLGDSWGTLLTMATINAVSVVVAGWLATRRLGPRMATLVYLAMAMLVWTMGSEILIDAAPMQMITLPFALFLFAVWSVADGDLVAVPVLAVVANFLVLDHLALTMLVPVVGLCAAVGLAVWLRGQRSDTEERTRLRTQLIRTFGLAIGLTVLMWIPSLIQQFRNSPGNLTNLWNAGKITVHNHNTWGQALDAVVSILVRPPFWLGNSFRDPSFGGQRISALEVVLGIALLIGLVALVVFAARKRDRTSLSALAVAIVVMVASTYNITRAPSPYGFRVQYLHSLWVMAMFVWLAVVVTLARNVPAISSSRGIRRVGSFGIAATLLVAAFTLPHRDPGAGTNGTSDTAVALNKQVLQPAADALRGKGQVEVVAVGSFSNFAVQAALILKLRSEGIDFCIPAMYLDQYGHHRACKPGGPDVVVTVDSAIYPPAPTETVIAEGSLLSQSDRDEFSALTGKVAHWLATQQSLEVTPATRQFLLSRFGATETKLRTVDAISPGDDPMQYLVYSPKFANFIHFLARDRPDGTKASPIETGSFPEGDLVRWADLAVRAYNGGTVRIAIQPPTS